MSPTSITKQITVALTLDVAVGPAGVVTQSLLDHIGQAMEIAYRNLEAEGAVTPNDDDDVSVSLTNISAADTTHAISVTRAVQDWRIGEGAQESMEPGDDAQYEMSASIGNQSYFDIRCPGDESRYLGIGIEINNGRPKVFITDIDGGDMVLHIAQTGEGIVVVPDCRMMRLKPAPANRYSYGGVANALIAERDHEQFALMTQLVGEAT